METISFQVGNTDFERFLALSKQTKQSTDAILNAAFISCLEDLEDVLAAKAVLDKNEPMYTLAEVEALLGLAGKI